MIDTARRREHIRFLREVSSGDDPLISRETAIHSARAWRLVWAASGRKMPVPAACTGPDGQMFYSWDRGRHHLELEVIPGQPDEFFYRDRETEQFWGEDYEIGDSLPDKVIAQFTHFESKR